MQKIRQDVSIGGNIRALRKKAGLTQEQIVAKLQLAGCDITRSIYSQIEGRTYNVRVSELIALRGILNVDFNAFFEGLSPA